MPQSDRTPFERIKVLIPQLTSAEKAALIKLLITNSTVDDRAAVKASFRTRTDTAASGRG